MRNGDWAPEGGPQASKTEVALSAVVVRLVGAEGGADGIYGT